MTGPTPPLALVALYGRALRYAEVERSGLGAGRLARLGTCEFDFDVDEAVFGLTGPTYLDAVGAALNEVFQHTAARTLGVVAHPSSTVGFFTPLPDGLPAAQRHEQLRQEAALLADVSPSQPVRIHATPVRAEALPAGPHRWHHVLHVPETVHARLTLLTKSLGLGSYDLADAAQAAAAVVRARLGAAGQHGFALALGAYGGHSEFVLVRDGAWYASHHGPGSTAEDTAYFAMALLERLAVAPGHVERLFVYGEDAGPERRHRTRAPRACVDSGMPAPPRRAAPLP